MDREEAGEGGYFSSSLVSGLGGDPANEGDVKFTQGSLQEERRRQDLFASFVLGFIVSSYPF